MIFFFGERKAFGIKYYEIFQKKRKNSLTIHQSKNDKFFLGWKIIIILFFQLYDVLNFQKQFSNKNLIHKIVKNNIFF